MKNDKQLGLKLVHLFTPDVCIFILLNFVRQANSYNVSIAFKN